MLHVLVLQTFQFQSSPYPVVYVCLLGLPAVVTLTAYYPDRTTDELPIPEACKRLQDAGATVVGLNCARGPGIMMPLIKEIKKLCTVNIRCWVLKDDLIICSIKSCYAHQ